MAKFLRISCKCPSIKDRKGRSNYLGSIQIDIPNTVHHHCKCCNSTWEHTANDNEVVTRKLVKAEIVYTDEIAIVDVR